tara:strand:- start:401 stop:1306 length:906 start_codon:yes stop_codon:yes gene_type:complete
MTIPKKTSNLHTLVQHYKKSHDFTKLRDQTQRDYHNILNKALMTKVEDSTLANIKVKDLSRRTFKVAYDSWLYRGVRTANITHAVVRKVLNYGIDLELLTVNPVSGIKTQAETSRNTTWTPEQVKLFLDTAYSQFKWRNIGLIVHMAYEFVQRIGDMRELTWDSIDFDKKLLTLEQSKRRATVFLPIEENLLSMLTFQKNDFGFQDYVAPSVKTITGGYKPYAKWQVSVHVNAIKAACGLPNGLQAMDMRRTGVTQMVDAGVDLAQIMSVSGHKNPNSVNPYMKNTLTSATNALTTRRNVL